MLRELIERGDKDRMRPPKTRCSTGSACTAPIPNHAPSGDPEQIEAWISRGLAWARTLDPEGADAAMTALCEQQVDRGLLEHAGVDDLGGSCTGLAFIEANEAFPQALEAASATALRRLWGTS